MGTRQPSLDSLLATPFDVVIVGSGMSGLTAALVLTKAYGRRVCVLEQHWKPGGQTHSFTRGGGHFEWDVGLHYISDVRGQQFPARLLRYLADDRLEWLPLDQRYDRIRFLDRDFDFVSGRDELLAALIREFPDERAALERYFSDLVRSAWNTAGDALCLTLPRPLAALARAITGRLADRRTTADYLRQRFRSQALRNLVASQWGDYGLPPEDSAFAIHALVASSFFSGGVYPQGGAGRIGEVLVDELERAGGVFVPNTKVARVVSERGRVTGLEVVHRHLSTNPSVVTLPARRVISTVGAYSTYRRLLDPPRFPELEELTWRSGMVILFATLDRDPRQLGFSNSNYWLHASPVDAPFEAWGDEGVFLSFPAMKKGHHESFTAEIIGFADPADFTAWRDTCWRRRGGDYEAHKQAIVASLLATAGRFFPELAAHVVTSELATPLSIEFFTGQAFGAPYGVPYTPGRNRLPYCQVRTPIEGLYLSGQDVFSLGVIGALMGGAISAMVCEGGPAFPRLILALSRHARVLATRARP